MFRYKSNKQAIIIAALIILLCFVCLTGSTLALFTNDPEKGTIEYKATRYVVEEVTDKDKEISLEDAQELNPDYNRPQWSYNNGSNIPHVR